MLASGFPDTLNYCFLPCTASQSWDCSLLVGPGMALPLTLFWDSFSVVSKNQRFVFRKIWPYGGSLSWKTRRANRRLFVPKKSPTRFCPNHIFLALDAFFCKRCGCNCVTFSNSSALGKSSTFLICKKAFQSNCSVHLSLQISRVIGKNLLQLAGVDKALGLWVNQAISVEQGSNR